MNGAPTPVRSLTPAEQEELRLFETGLRAFLAAPFEVLRDRGVVRTAHEMPDIRTKGPRWFLGAGDDVAVAFFLLVKEAHAASEAALAAAPALPS